MTTDRASSGFGPILMIPRGVDVGVKGPLMAGLSIIAAAINSPLMGIDTRTHTIHAVPHLLPTGSRRRTVDSACGRRVRLVVSKVRFDDDGDEYPLMMPWPPRVRELRDSGGTRCPDCVAEIGRMDPRSTIKLENLDGP